ncbi:MAG: D-glycerate dehydrogenase [Bacteroidota bacterium]|nr:D-glycerate dehydrogenase [Bacteroidota bacterium]MDP4211090.1 D-glycerate dehydrogenase [Bacteroidota bacterium]MDP4249175.1 D-glycerate dehydrogenase [Bacteroidota bacterium]
MKVFVTRIIPEAGLRLMKDAGLEISQWTEKRDLTPQELIDHCKPVDALLSAGTNQIDKTFLNACAHLKVISLHSVGYDRVDVPTATALKIPIGNTPGVLTDATADVAFLLILAASRKAFYLHESIERGDWGFFEPKANLGIEIRGKTLGVFGLGKIGFELARCCATAFGMKIIYHNRNRHQQAEKELKAEWVSFDELLRQSDVLSVNTALTPETKGKFNKEAFGKMKPCAIFINAARGGIHNEPDLIEALQKQTIWGAGLDVTDPEPMRPDNPLLRMPNVAVLPHIGSATVETRNAMAVIAAKNIIAGVKGERLLFSVNPEVYSG